MSNDERKRLRAMVDKLSLARTANDDTPCQMKRCKDCGDWKPFSDFYLRKRGAGMGRLSYCKECQAVRWRVRNEECKRKDSVFANRLPAETAQDYAQHVFRVWPNVALMELAISHAKPELRPAIKRELVAMAWFRKPPISEAELGASAPKQTLDAAA